MPNDSWSCQQCLKSSSPNFLKLNHLHSGSIKVECNKKCADSQQVLLTCWPKTSSSCWKIYIPQSTLYRKTVLKGQNIHEMAERVEKVWRIVHSVPDFYAKLPNSMYAISLVWGILWHHTQAELRKKKNNLRILIFLPFFCLNLIYNVTFQSVEAHQSLHLPFLSDFITVHQCDEKFQTESLKKE